MVIIVTVISIVIQKMVMVIGINKYIHIYIYIIAKAHGGVAVLRRCFWTCSKLVVRFDNIST